MQKKLIQHIRERFAFDMEKTRQGAGGLSVLNLKPILDEHGYAVYDQIQSSELNSKKYAHMKTVQRFVDLASSDVLHEYLKQAYLLLQIPNAYLFTEKMQVVELTVQRKRLEDGICNENYLPRLAFLFDGEFEDSIFFFEHVKCLDKKYSLYELKRIENDQVALDDMDDAYLMNEDDI